MILIGVAYHSLKLWTDIALPVTKTPEPSASVESLLRFTEELRGEAKEQREYLKDSLDELKWIVVTILGVGGALAGWLTISSRKEIQPLVKEQFEAHVESLVTARLKGFLKFLDTETLEIQARGETTSRLVGRIADFACAFITGILLF